jgi:hypothetical protein
MASSASGATPSRSSAWSDRGPQVLPGYQSRYHRPPIEADVDRSHARPMDEHDAADACRFCGGSLLTSVFDTSFRDTAAEERLFFAIPGALCVPCRQLYVDRQLIGILGLSEAQCTFAIQSDRVLRAGAA